MPRVDHRAVQQLLCSVHVSDHDSLVMRTVSVFLNCPLTDVYFIVYRLFVCLYQVFFSNVQSATMYCYNADLI